MTLKPMHLRCANYDPNTYDCSHLRCDCGLFKKKHNCNICKHRKHITICRGCMLITGGLAAKNVVEGMYPYFEPLKGAK